MSTAPIPALAPVMRTVLPSNLDALKMDIDEQEVIEFNDRMDSDSFIMFASATPLVKEFGPISGSLLFCPGSYPKWNECSDLTFVSRATNLLTQYGTI